MNDPISFSNAINMANSIGFVGGVPRCNNSSHDIEGIILSHIANCAGKPINVWIGPEGGFSHDENTLIDQHDIIPIVIGDHILRVETAVAAILGVLQYVVSDAST